MACVIRVCMMLAPPFSVCFCRRWRHRAAGRTLRADRGPLPNSFPPPICLAQLSPPVLASGARTQHRRDGSDADARQIRPQGVDGPQDRKGRGEGFKGQQRQEGQDYLQARVTERGLLEGERGEAGRLLCDGGQM